MMADNNLQTYLDVPISSIIYITRGAELATRLVPRSYSVVCIPRKWLVWQTLAANLIVQGNSNPVEAFRATVPRYRPAD